VPDWTTITLKIEGSSAEGRYTTHLYVDETPIATNQTLSPDATQAQRELSHKYLSLFEQSGLPLVEEQTLNAIGYQLFETWLDHYWAEVEDAFSPTDPRRFVVASDVPAVLNLPWSLLRLPGEDEPLGLDPNDSIRLHPATQRLAESQDEPRPGPLRVLYSACAPRGAEDLSYEREEHQLLQTLTQPEYDVAHFGCDLGAFDEFKERVGEYRPHVVHLTGHGFIREGEGQFAFEDERGYTDLRPGEEIVDEALDEAPDERRVQCVFVSGCETGRAPEVEALNGVCQSLVMNGVPVAVGWAHLSLRTWLQCSLTASTTNSVREGMWMVLLSGLGATRVACAESGRRRRKELSTLRGRCRSFTQRRHRPTCSIRASMSQRRSRPSLRIRCLG
jgi:hypothetical protein